MCGYKACTLQVLQDLPARPLPGVVEVAQREEITQACLASEEANCADCRQRVEANPQPQPLPTACLVHFHHSSCPGGFSRKEILVTPCRNQAGRGQEMVGVPRYPPAALGTRELGLQLTLL